jgi:DNA-binding transcriptional LysR family regulator
MPSLSTTYIDPQALLTFVTVARIGNVTRAAEVLHRSQPAISLQIKNLSELTGLKLFQRTHQGMELTVEGAALRPLAEKALGALSEFSQAVCALQTTVRDTLRVGTILDPEFTQLGAFLLNLANTNPLIDTRLQHEVSGEVYRLVDTGQLDLGFYLEAPEIPTGKSILRKQLTCFTYCVLAPAGWEDRVHDQDWAALASLPWLETPPSSVHHRLQRKVFGPGSLTGLQPRRVALVDQEPSMLDLVRNGLGLSLVRESIAQREAHTSGLVMANRVSLQCELSVICRSGRETEPAIKAALSTLEQVWNPASSA